MVLRSSPHSIWRDGWQDIVSLALEPTLCLSFDTQFRCTAGWPDWSRPASIIGAYHLPLSQCRYGCNLQRPTRHGSGNTPDLDDLADVAQRTPYLPELPNHFRSGTAHGPRNDDQPEQRISDSATTSFERKTASQHRPRERPARAILL